MLTKEAMDHCLRNIGFVIVVYLKRDREREAEGRGGGGEGERKKGNTAMETRAGGEGVFRTP